MNHWFLVSLSFMGLNYEQQSAKEIVQEGLGINGKAGTGKLFCYHIFVIV